MTKKLFFASGNPSKIKEYTAMLKKEGIAVLNKKDLNISDQAEEDQPTFKENAVKKAKFYYQLSGLPTLAEDAGFEIDYLNGAPGINSRRIMGYEATDEELVEWLKKQVAKIPQNQRTCRFRAVSCLVLSPEEIYTAEHSIEGCLTDGIRTDYQPGLPYRSMFLEKNSGKFLMDLSQEEYENVNHRQKNIMAIIKYL
ncbi:MAG TPA: non-canonical purine NTP pyrophosphatase [Patescibacteria group bacterium]|nr:non-canonical purine NTP pyrophosphatase [Patescibacteria group bacterium]